MLPALVPLLVRVSEVVSLALPVAVLLAPGLVAALPWSPFLLADRLRELFRTLPPRDGFVGSYLPVTVGGVVPYVGGWLWAFSRSTGRTSAIVVEGLLDAQVALSLVYAVCGLLLGTGSAWPTVLYGVPLFVVATTLAYPA
jgi:hypothetical protein